MDGGDGRRESAVEIMDISHANGGSMRQFEGFCPVGRERENGWTDEKHNLYLNSIEASFVKYLQCQKYRLRHLHGWLSRRQGALDPNSAQSNSNEHFSLDQVLQRGGWEKLNIEKPQKRANNRKESCLSLENQSIRHARPASTNKSIEVRASDIQQHGEMISEVVHFGGQKYRTAVFGLATSSKQRSPSYSAICRQESVGSNTDISDQNFVEEDFDRKPSSSSCKKRPRVAAADVSNTDQVVPSLVAVTAKESYSQGNEDEHCSAQQPETIQLFSKCGRVPPPSEDR